MIDRLICRAEVSELTGLSRASIYRLTKLGKFPESVVLDEPGGAVAWRQSAVQAWIDSRPLASATRLPPSRMGKHQRARHDARRLAELMG